MSVLQPLNQPVAVVSNSTGAATFTFPHIPLSQVWIGSLSCATAPDTASFSATSTSTQFGSFKGSNSIGPIQLQAGDTLVVTATGLIPSTPYTVTMIGYVMTEAGVQPIVPNSYADTVTTSTENFLIGSFSYPGPKNYAVNTTIPGSKAWRSLWVLAGNDTTSPSSVPYVTLYGVSTNVYYAPYQPPYIDESSNPNVFFFKFPILPIDQSYILTYVDQGTSSTFPYTVYYGADLQAVDSMVYDGSSSINYAPLHVTTARNPSNSNLYPLMTSMANGTTQYFNSALPTGTTTIALPAGSTGVILHHVYCRSSATSGYISFGVGLVANTYEVGALTDPTPGSSPWSDSITMNGVYIITTGIPSGGNIWINNQLGATVPFFLSYTPVNDYINAYR